MPALALPAFWGAVSAGAAGGAALYGSRKMGQASDRAAKIQEQSNADTMALAREQEAQRRKEYDDQIVREREQWDAEQSLRAPYRAAGRQALMRLGDLTGMRLNLPEPPAFSESSRGSSTAPDSNDAAALDYFHTVFPGDDLSPEMLSAKEADLNAKGIKLLRNAAGRAGKIILPSGMGYDVILGAGAGTNKKQLLPLERAASTAPTGSRGMASVAPPMSLSTSYAPIIPMRALVRR